MSSIQEMILRLMIIRANLQERITETTKPKVHCYQVIQFLNHCIIGRLKTSSLELKPFNSFTNLTKVEEQPTFQNSFATTDPSPTALINNLKKLRDSRDPKGLESVRNMVKSRLGFPAKDLDLQNPEHFRMVEQMYSQQYYAPSYPMNHSNAAPSTDYNSVNTKPQFTERSAYLHPYKTESSTFAVKKEHDHSKPGVMNSPFISKNFPLLQSPALKMEAKPYGNENMYEHYYFPEHNDENINTVNYSKADSFGDHSFFDSPLRKKVKFNGMGSPNLLDNEAPRPNPKITDR